MRSIQWGSFSTKAGLISWPTPRNLTALCCADSTYDMVGAGPTNSDDTIFFCMSSLSVPPPNPNSSFSSLMRPIKPLSNHLAINSSTTICQIISMLAFHNSALELVLSRVVTTSPLSLS